MFAPSLEVWKGFYTLLETVVDLNVVHLGGWVDVDPQRTKLRWNRELIYCTVLPLWVIFKHFGTFILFWLLHVDVGKNLEICNGICSWGRKHEWFKTLVMWFFNLYDFMVKTDRKERFNDGSEIFQILFEQKYIRFFNFAFEKYLELFYTGHIHIFKWMHG